MWAGCDTRLYTYSRVLVHTKNTSAQPSDPNSKIPDHGTCPKVPPAPSTALAGTDDRLFTFFQPRFKTRLREPSEHSVFRTRAFGRLNVRRVRIRHTPLFACLVDAVARPPAMAHSALAPRFTPRARSPFSGGVKRVDSTFKLSTDRDARGTGIAGRDVPVTAITHHDGQDM